MKQLDPSSIEALFPQQDEPKFGVHNGGGSERWDLHVCDRCFHRRWIDPPGEKCPPCVREFCEGTMHNDSCGQRRLLFRLRVWVQDRWPLKQREPGDPSWAERRTVLQLLWRDRLVGALWGLLAAAILITLFCWGLFL